MKSGPASTLLQVHSSPVAVVVDAVRRAWARISERGQACASASEAAPADMDSLLAKHDVRRGRPHEGPSHAFHAPSLVFIPAEGFLAGREVRRTAHPGAGIARPEPYAPLFKPLR